MPTAWVSSLTNGGLDRGGTLGGEGSGEGCGCGAGSSPPPPPQPASANASADEITMPMPRPSRGRTADARTIIALSPYLENHANVPTWSRSAGSPHDEARCPRGRAVDHSADRKPWGESAFPFSTGVDAPPDAYPGPDGPLGARAVARRRQCAAGIVPRPDQISGGPVSIFATSGAERASAAPVA